MSRQGSCYRGTSGQRPQGSRWQGEVHGHRRNCRANWRGADSCHFRHDYRHRFRRSGAAVEFLPARGNDRVCARPAWRQGFGLVADLFDSGGLGAGGAASGPVPRRGFADHVGAGVVVGRDHRRLDLWRRHGVGPGLFRAPVGSGLDREPAFGRFRADLCGGRTNEPEGRSGPAPRPAGRVLGDAGR